MATTTSRPITCRFICASALSSPVSLWRYCLIGSWGANFFQPNAVVVMEAGLVVVDKHRSGYVHGVDEHESLFHAALAKAILHLRRDVDKGNPRRRVEPKFFPITFHDPPSFGLPVTGPLN